MRSFLIIVVLITLSAFHMQSQTLSPGYKLSSKTNIEGFLMEKEDKVYLIKTDYSAKNVYAVLLSVYDTTNLKKQFEKKISVTTKKGFVVKPLEVISLKGKIYFFYSELNTVTGTHLLYANHIDLNGEKVWSKEMDTISHTFSSDDNLEIVSNDSENQLIIVRRYAEGFDNPNVINIKSYDPELNIQWESNTKLPINERNATFHEILFEGKNVYLYSRISKRGRNSQSQYKYHYLWCYNYDKDLLKEYELALEERQINELALRLSKTDLVINGTFSTSEKKTLDGLFSLRLNNNFEIQHTSLVDLNSNKIHEWVGERDVNSSISEFYIKGMEILNDGRSFLFTEKVFKTISDYLDPRTNMYNYTEMFHYNNVLVFEFDSEGNFTQTHSIVKKQASRSDNGYFSSIQSASDGDHLWLFFNDHKTNDDTPINDLKMTRPLSEFRSMALAVVKYEDGKFVKKKYYNKLNNYTPKIIDGKRFANHQYFFSEKTNKYQLLKLTLPH